MTNDGDGTNILKKNKMKTKVLQEQQTSQLQLRGTLSQVKISISIETEKALSMYAFQSV